MVDRDFLTRSYDTYGRVEEEFNALLDESLDPHGPQLLYDLVAQCELPAGSTALDVGCGEGDHAIALATRFGLRVHGVDPVARHIALARAAAARSAATFTQATVQDLPGADASVDLVWCRDVLCHVADLDGAYAQMRRVLKPDGTALIYQTFATDALEPREAAWLFPIMGCVASSMDTEVTESAVASAGLTVARRIELGSQWGEWGQEQHGKGGRKLLHTARLLRDRKRLIERFGRDNYDIALGDGLWHVYRLIGKLSDRVYVLTAL